MGISINRNSVGRGQGWFGFKIFEEHTEMCLKELELSIVSTLGSNLFNSRARRRAWAKGACTSTRTTYKLHDGGEGVVEVVGGHGEVNWSLKTGCREAETGIHIGSPQSQLNFGLDKNSQEVVKEEKTR